MMALITFPLFSSKGTSEISMGTTVDPDYSVPEAYLCCNVCIFLQYMQVQGFDDVVLTL